MKVKIDSDEWYPVYSIVSYGTECEVPEDTVQRWNRIMGEFDVMQKEMRETLKAAFKPQQYESKPTM